MSSCSKENGNDLPTDVLNEIFVRLPLKQVFKFRCVSKLWNSLLSNQFLLHKLWTTTVYVREGYCQSTFLPSHPFPAQTMDDHYPKLHHNSMNDHDLFSIQYLLDNNPFDKVYLLSSSINGLLLYITIRSNFKTFKVCNPLTKQCVSLPPRPALSSYDFASLVSESSTSSSYKVVTYTHKLGDDTITLEVFSSDTGEWRTDEVHSDEPLYLVYNFSPHMVIHRGVLYWTCRIEGVISIIACNLENKIMPRNRVMLINLPKDIKDHYKGFFGVSEGSIYYGNLVSHQAIDMPSCFLSVWMLEDHYNGEWVWVPVHTNIEVKGHELLNTMFDVFQCFNHPEDRNVVIFSKGFICLAYNIGTRTWEVLRGSASSLRSDGFHRLRKLLITPKPTRIPSLSPSH